MFTTWWKTHKCKKLSKKENTEKHLVAGSENQKQKSIEITLSVHKVASPTPGATSANQILDNFVTL